MLIVAATFSSEVIYASMDQAVRLHDRRWNLVKRSVSIRDIFPHDIRIRMFFLLQEYLHHFYGHTSKRVRPKRTAVSDEGSDRTTGLCNKIRDMQRFFGLPPSGELTQETMAAMRRPRCGLSDAEPFGDTIRWKKKILSYRSETMLTHHLAWQQQNFPTYEPTNQPTDQPKLQQSFYLNCVTKTSYCVQIDPARPQHQSVTLLFICISKFQFFCFFFFACQIFHRRNAIVTG